MGDCSTEQEGLGQQLFTALMLQNVTVRTKDSGVEFHAQGPRTGVYLDCPGREKLDVEGWQQAGKGGRRVLVHTSALSPCVNLKCAEEELLTVSVSDKHLCSLSSLFLNFSS